MLEVLRAELEREFEIDEIRRIGSRYLGLDGITATTRAEAASEVVDKCALLDSIEALADSMVVERPAMARRLSDLRRAGYRPVEPLERGSTLGDFTLEAVVGTSPDATVYRARDRQNLVRIRVLREPTRRSRDAVNRYLAAARACGTVSDRWLPAHLRAVTIADRVTVVHDWFEGETLDARANDPLRLNDAWPTLRRVLTGLGSLHARGFTHGALHAGNIVTAQTGDPPPLLLLDAGAHYLRAGTLVGGLGMGRVSPLTAAWAAPEQLLGGLPTPRSDVYAIGLLIYRLVAGRLPIPADTPDLARQRLSTEPDPIGFVAPRGTVPEGLDELVLRLLDSDPNRRPPDAMTVLELLAPIVSSRASAPSVLPELDIDREMERLLANPSDETAAGVLEAAIDQGADPRRVADALVLAADTLDKDESTRSTRRRLLVRAGALYENLVGDARAAERAYRSVLEADRQDEGVFTALERVYKRLGDHDKLVELLLDRRDSLESPQDRGRVLARLSHVLASELGDEAQALVALGEAVAEDPENDAHAAALERLAHDDRKAWKSVLESLAQTAEGQTDPERSSRLWLRVGQWYETRLARPDLALPCYQAVIAVDPTQELALDRIAETYRRAQLWPELCQALLSRASMAAVPARARELRVEAARVSVEHAGAETTARDLLEQVLGEDATHSEAARLLAELHRRAGRHRDWMRVMEQRADAATGVARRDLLVAIAHGYAEHLDDPDGSITAWEQVIAEFASDLEALRALEAAYREAGLPAKSVAVLERQLEIALTPRQRVVLLERIAKLHESELLDDVSAADALERLLEIDADNDAVLTRLADVYRRSRNWDALAFTLERRSERGVDGPVRIDLLLEVGRLSKDELGNPVRALGAFETVMRLDPSNSAALDAAARLRAELGDTASAADALEALAEQAETPARRAEHWLKAADLFKKRGDTEAAEYRYRRALDEVPGHADAARELGTSQALRGDALGASSTLERALNRAESARDKAEIGAALARVLLEQRADPGRARGAASVALENDPANARVHFVLGDLDRLAENFSDAARHYETAALRLEQFDEAEVPRLLANQIEVLAQAGSIEKARELLELLVARAQERRDALEAAARLAFEIDTPERALELTERLLELHEQTLPIAELAAHQHRRGELLRRLDRLDEAVQSLESAANTDRRALEPLRALIEIYKTRGQLDELRATLDRLLELASADDRYDLLIEIGDTAAEVLHDPDLATKAYVTALVENPDDRKILVRLMRLYSDGQDWQRLVEVVLRLADLTRDRRERARYVQTAARISAEEMGDMANAIDLYDRAMKDDPSSETIVSEALSVRSKAGDMAGIRSILEAQIARASAQQDRERAYRLATRLADLHLTELDASDAIAINEAALKLIGVDPEREVLLSDLYMTDPKRYLDRAATLERRALDRDPRRPEPYRRLRELSLGAGRRDAAWCASQALFVLQQANSDEEAYYREHRGSTPIAPSSRIADGEWAKLVAHPSANSTVSSLLIQIHPVIAGALKRYSFEALGLNEKEALDPSECEGTLVRCFERAADVLRIPLPLFFERPEMKVAVMLGKGARQHVLLSKTAAHGALPDARAAFLAASSLVLLRPGMNLRVLLPPTELKAWVLGAVRLVAPKVPVPADLEKFVQTAHRLLSEQLPTAVRNRIRQLIDTLLSSGGQADLTRWTNGVDLTSDRAGLLFSNDLGASLAVIRAAGDSALSLGVAERESALLAYSVSSEYLRLRNRLRVSIDWSDVEEIEVGDMAPIDAV